MSKMHIDAVASLRQGQVVPASSADARASASLFGRALQMARTTISERNDGGTAQHMLDRFDAAVDRVTAKALNTSNTRYDAIGAEGGGLLAGQLRHVLSEVLEEKHPTPNGLRLFSVDSTVPLGARTVGVRRIYEAGEARIFRGGDSSIPTVSLAQAEMDFQVRHYITSAVWDVFEEMSAQYAQSSGVSLDYVAQLARIARDVLERFTNDMTWNGDATARIYGVLNYPWLDKEVSSVSFGGSPADTNSRLAALNAFVNRQRHASKGVMGPNKMVTSPRVADWIMQTGLQSSADSLRDRTIGEVLLATGRLEGPIEQAWELEGILGAGVDGILLYRDDALGIQNVIPGGGIRSLPLHQTDIERRQVFFMPHAGVRMLEVGNNLLVYVTWAG